MFLIAKTALVTCAIYVGIAILLEALLLGVTHTLGETSSPDLVVVPSDHSM